MRGEVAGGPSPIEFACLDVSALRRLFEPEALEVLAKRRAQIGALESKFDRRLQEPELVAGVVAFPFEEVAIDGSAREERLQSAGQLDLAADLGLRVAENAED